MKRGKLINVIIFLLSFTMFSTVYARVTYSAEKNVVKYQAKGHRDPFVSLMVTRQAVVQINGLVGVRSADDIEIQGFVIDDKRGSYVIANGVILREGEQQADVRVIEITPRGVQFLINENVEFKVFEEDQS